MSSRDRRQYNLGIKREEAALHPEDADSFSALKHIIARLRAADGCPWDREQTHASLKANLVEECYEVVEAIDEEDPKKLCQELGDLLMQIVLHAQIAAEAQEFEMEDVARSISDKLIHRHPHIFGQLKVKDAQEVTLNWEALKREERPANGSLVASLPQQMPTLAYSQAIQRRAARVGFDWENLEGVLEKLVEEVEELKEATTQQQRTQEFGDLLFTLANIARRLDIDLEVALSRANRRFQERFNHMEKVCQERGVSLESLSPEELNALWEEAKRQTKS